MQLRDVLLNGYWHARSPLYLDQPLTRFIAWMRMPADLVFIVFGVVPIVVATLMAYWFSVRAPKGAQQPSAAK